MGRNTIRFSIGFPKDTYEEITKIAEELGVPKSRVINAILSGYLRSRKEREKKND